MPKIWVIGPIKHEAGESSRAKERLRDKGKGKAREVAMSWNEVVAKVEEDQKMWRRRIAWRIVERQVDLEMLMDKIEGLEEL